MLLAIDIGNTNVVIGLYQGEKLRSSWRLQSDPKRTVDEYALEILALLRSDDQEVSAVQTIIIACVVPALTRVFTKLSEKYFNLQALVVGPGLKTGISVSVDDPRMVGADRIVNAVAAKEQFGAPVIVVDFGTATTFDVVGESGKYEGGVIAPGLLISSQALFDKAALLPPIELRAPEVLVGKNTQDSMLSGIVYGYVGLVDGILDRLVEEIGEKTPIVCTGGLAHLLRGESRYVKTIVPDLTLFGLHLIASKNS